MTILESHVVRLAAFTVFNTLIAFCFLDNFNERLEYLSQEAHIEASKEMEINPNDESIESERQSNPNYGNRIVVAVLSPNRTELPFSNDQMAEFWNGW